MEIQSRHFTQNHISDPHGGSISGNHQCLSTISWQSSCLDISVWTKMVDQLTDIASTTLSPSAQELQQPHKLFMPPAGHSH